MKKVRPRSCYLSTSVRAGLAHGSPDCLTHTLTVSNLAGGLPCSGFPRLQIINRTDKSLISRRELHRPRETELVILLTAKVKDLYFLYVHLIFAQVFCLCDPVLPQGHHTHSPGSTVRAWPFCLLPHMQTDWKKQSGANTAPQSHLGLRPEHDLPILSSGYQTA